MNSYQDAFLRLALQHEVLRFGSFTLKSGRTSPYFFNLGQISSGAALRELGRAYAQALLASGLEFDMLFGPAYKGIPLVAAVSIALAEMGHDASYAYNRKEAKAHGEGGQLVGHPPRGRVVIVDDVLTAGTAMRESVGLLRAAGATPVAALIALDRQETGPSGQSTVRQLEDEVGLKVLALVSVGDVMEFLGRRGQDATVVQAIQAYQARYGVRAEHGGE